MTPTISSVTASSIHRNSGEWFVRIVGTGLAPISGVTIEFAGPPGTVSQKANAGTDSYVDVWVPEVVLLNPGSYTVQVRATDAAGTVSSNTLPFGIFSSTVRLEFLELQLVEAISREGGFGRYIVNATSQMSDVVTVDCSRKSGELYPIGDTVIDCYAQDDLGGATKGSFTLRVADTTPPSIKTPDDMVVFGDGDGAKVAYDISVSDAVDPEPKVGCFPSSGSFFPIGTTIVNCTSTDLYRNTTKVAFRVHVGDEARPALILPETVQAESESREGAYVSFKPTAIDIKGSEVGVECSPGSGSFFPVGLSAVKCSAGRAFGEFTVNVADTTAPYLDVPRDFVEKAAGVEGAKVSFPVGAKDSVDGEVRVTCAPSSGSLFAIGKTTVNCSTSDSSGNTTRDSFSVEVLPYDDPSPWETYPGYYELGPESPSNDVEPPQ
ncbi:MAG TPA: HYR domain-containing protein [Thermoanaerobaculia bacterium]